MEEKKGKRFNIFNLTVSFITLFIVISFLLLLYFSYTNFNEVKNGNKPTGYKEVKKYTKNQKEITVYNYTLYKIVVIKKNKTTTYMLKPAFIDEY